MSFLTQPRFGYQNGAQIRRHSQSYPNELLAGQTCFACPERKHWQIIGQFHSWDVFSGLRPCELTSWPPQYHGSVPMKKKDWNWWCSTKLMMSAISGGSFCISTVSYDSVRQELRWLFWLHDESAGGYSSERLLVCLIAVKYNTSHECSVHQFSQILNKVCCTRWMWTAQNLWYTVPEKEVCWKYRIKATLHLLLFSFFDGISCEKMIYYLENWKKKKKAFLFTKKLFVNGFTVSLATLSSCECRLCFSEELGTDGKCFEWAVSLT